AALPAVAAAGDHRAADALLNLLRTKDQLRHLVMMLAGSLRYQSAVSPAPANVRRWHAIHERLRNAGVPKDEMPVAVQEGEREYQARMWKAGTRARQRGEAA